MKHDETEQEDEIKNPRSREMETFPLSGFLQEKAQLKTHRGEKHFHTPNLEQIKVGS